MRSLEDLEKLCKIADQLTPEQLRDASIDALLHTLDTMEQWMEYMQLRMDRLEEKMNTQDKK